MEPHEFNLANTGFGLALCLWALSDRRWGVLLVCLVVSALNAFLWWVNR